MTTLSILFWYVAIGALFYIRVYYRVIKANKEKLLKKFERKMGADLYSVDIDPYTLMNIAALLACTLMWPFLLTKPRVIFTNVGPVFKNGWDK